MLVKEMLGHSDHSPFSTHRDVHKASMTQSLSWLAAGAGLTSGQVATLDVLVKEMLGRSDRPFSIADVMQRCVEKKLALSETAITQVCFCWPTLSA